MDKPKNFDKMLAAVKESYQTGTEILHSTYLGRYKHEGDLYHNVLVVFKLPKSEEFNIFIERVEYSSYDKEWGCVDSIELAQGDLENIQNMAKISFKTMRVLYGK